MQCIVQRVSMAEVWIDSYSRMQPYSKINGGILLLLGIDKTDDINVVKKAADKILHYRIFSDSSQKMNVNLINTKGSLLVVSQFTLSAQTSKGLRPSFSKAAEPSQAQMLYEQLITYCKQSVTVESGEFGADMQVKLLNDGPVTFSFTF